MLPTLNNYNDENIKDYVYINRFASYTYQDIIVVNNPQGDNTNKNIIKRVIALEKDKIAVIKTNSGSLITYKIALIKNGSDKLEILNENYLAPNTSLLPAYEEFNKLITQTNFSGGKVVDVNGTKYLEIAENHIFYLGDNRSSSSASNDCLDYGPVSKDKVVGKVDIIVKENKNHIKYIFNYFTKKLIG